MRDLKTLTSDILPRVLDKDESLHRDYSERICYRIWSVLSDEDRSELVDEGCWKVLKMATHWFIHLAQPAVYFLESGGDFDIQTKEYGLSLEVPLSEQLFNVSVYSSVMMDWDEPGFKIAIDRVMWVLREWDGETERYLLELDANIVRQCDVSTDETYFCSKLNTLAGLSRNYLLVLDEILSEENLSKNRIAMDIAYLISWMLEMYSVSMCVLYNYCT